MGLKAAVQALKKAETLKDKVQGYKDLLNDSDAWVCQQQLQKIYQQVLILDLEYALDRKVEQELWNLGFKNYIALLQSQAKDRKNPKRGESQAMLSWCLEAASGFYLTLLQEICTAFDLDLPFRRKGYVYGCTSPWKAVENLSAPHKSSCFYACQYCLVHLGDIARYRNQNKQAELFYRHAVSLSPSSGQPYNQLALLEASRGDKLGTVFHYVRSVAVKHPFSVASANLAITLSSALSDNSLKIDGKTRLDSQEYISVFLKLHGIIHNLGDMALATTYVKLLTETLTALVVTESFSSWRLVQMLVINLYALQHIGTSSANENVKQKKLARNCILDLIAGSLSALLIPVYTIKSAVVDYFALPTIKLCLEWIKIKPNVLEEVSFTSRLQIWPSFCVLLNGLQGCLANFSFEKYLKVPLPEDRDLQGFLPLEKVFEAVRFTSAELEDDTAALNKLRAVRLLQLGRCLAQQNVNGTPLISIAGGPTSSEDKFTSSSAVAGPSNELMRELEELCLNKERQPIIINSPVPSETASSKESSELDITEHLLEKRVGILKPQGSLERSRDSNNVEVNNMDAIPTPAIRKPRQNVAMQAIMRRAEYEQKQVTFKNISPVIIEESEAEKVAKTAAGQINNGGVPPTSTQNRFAASLSVQSAPAPVQSTSQAAKPPPQLVQFSPNDQQSLPNNQFGNLQQNAVPTVYPTQSFNVQNPQFNKGYVPSRMPNVAQYQMPPQFPDIDKSIGMNQSRMMHHRINQANISINPSTQIPQQGLNAPVQPNIASLQGMTLRSPPQQPMDMHQAMTLQQQNNALGIQSNVHQSPLRSNGLTAPHSMSLAGAPLSNNLLNLSAYQNNIQQQSSQIPVNSTSYANIPPNYNPSFAQNAFDKSMMGKNYERTIDQQHQLPFQNQSGNYPVFPNYESQDFKLWKDTQQPPQPPITWWESAPRVAPQIHAKESTSKIFPTWTNNHHGSIVSGQVSMNPGNNYSSNAVNQRGFNNFDDGRSFDMDQKQSQQAAAPGNTYSLFSGNTWGTGGNQVSSSLNQQSLWSGSGLSPLERLLEQQKSLREGGT